jgi:cyanophycin synthetase
MEITRIRALRGPNLWSRQTAIEAIVTCDESQRDLRSNPAFELRLRELFPAVGALHGDRPEIQVSMAHALERCPGPAGAGRLPGHLQPHHPHRSPRHLPGGGAVHGGSRRPSGLHHAEALCRAALDGSPFDCAAALAALRELDEDERLGPPPAPSCTPPWHAASPSGA